MYTRILDNTLRFMDLPSLLFLLVRCHSTLAHAAKNFGQYVGIARNTPRLFDIAEINSSLAPLTTVKCKA